MFDRHALRSTLPLAPAALALLTVVLVVVADARGGVSWRSTGALLIAALVVAAAQPAIRRSFAARAAKLSDRRRLVASLDELAAADLVRAKAIAAELPPGLAVPMGEALAPLEVLASRIQSSSVEVAGAAGAVKRIASELAAGSSEQSASVVEITAAMEELAQTATQIAGNAEAQAELARLGEVTGNEGAAAVGRAVAGVERLRERIAAIAKRAADLERRAEEIFGVLALVEDIARETHLLSLNAAIEAAGEGGDVGRRFGEVAEEVRRLSGRSRDAAASVRRLLEEFSTSIAATVEATGAGGGEAERVLLRVTATAAAITGLRDALVETAAAAREISAGTSEQRTASLQVVQTLREASSVVQQIADGLRGFSGVARDLEDAAVNVQLLAQGFRLASPSSLRHLAESWATELQPLLASPDALERRLESLLEERPDVELVFVNDRRRQRTAIVGQPALVRVVPIPDEVRFGRDFSDRPWFRAAASERRGVVTSVMTSILTNEKVVTAAAPFFEDGELIAVLGIDVNLERWTSG
ncbi:MAG: methyl-accepting chemotaxis protein [Thermoanaerobaculia bacterium]